MTMESFAEHIIAVAHENNMEITNLQLQKVMYFTLKEAIKNNINPNQLEEIYDKPFLVWRYGPVEKDTYEKYRVFGASPIMENDVENSNYTNLNAFIIKYLKINVFDLVERSHREKFWKENESRINGWRSSVEYSLRDIKAY